MAKLQQLHDLLLDRNSWPKDFEWDYGDSKYCALGLAFATNIVKHLPEHITNVDFKISDDAFDNIFYNLDGSILIEESDKVTPEIVAERIRKWMK